MKKYIKFMALIASVLTGIQAFGYYNGQDWVGGGEDTLYSNSANWYNGRETNSTAAVRFDGQSSKTVTFDGNYTTTDYLWIGSTSATYYNNETWYPVVWEATDPAYGLAMTGSKKNFVIADASNQNGALKIVSGTYNFNYTMNIGSNGGKAYFEMADGSLTIGSQFNVGISGANAYFKMTGGEIAINGESYWFADANTVGVADILGGKVVANKDLTLANNASATGTINLGNGGELDCGTESTAKWLKSQTGTVIFNLNEGGTLGIWHLDVGGVSTTVNFNGGTIKNLGTDSGNCKYLINDSTAATVTVGENGGFIDVNGNDSRLAKVVGGTGTLSITNSKVKGSMIFETAPTCNLKVASENVSLYLPTGYTGNIELVEGAMLIFDVSSAEDGALDLATVGTLTLPEGADINDYIFAYCPGKNTTVAHADGKITATIATPGENETITTTWIGGNSDHNWLTDTNWSNGAPTATDTVRFVADSTAVRYTTNDSAEFAKLVVANGAVVTLKSSSDSNYPHFSPHAIEGTGTLHFYRCGLNSVSGYPLDIPSTINLEFSNNGHSSTSADAWLQGEYAAITVNGKVTVNDYLRSYKAITYTGEIVLNEGCMMQLEDASTVSAKISGAGSLKICASTTFSGDNSGFTGTFSNSAYNITPTFATADSGSASATFNIVGDMRISATSGTIKFGELNLTKGNWCYCYINKDCNLTVEVGGKNTDMNWGSGYMFGTLTDGSSSSTSAYTDAILRKVGTGTLYTYADQYSYIECAEGVVQFMDRHGAGTSFRFAGGTFGFPSAYDWDPTGRFVDAGGVYKIDTGDNDFSWTGNFSGTHGLVKKGSGTLTLTSMPNISGAITVEEGELILPSMTITPEGTTITPNATTGKIALSAGLELPQSFTIGSQEAIVIDGSTLFTAGTTQVGDKVVLFKTPTCPTFEYANDTFNESIFLSGPVVGTDIKWDAELSAVVAEVTDITNIASTRSVKFWTHVTGSGADEGWQWIDQGTGYDDGVVPTDYGHDIVVYCGDSQVLIWANQGNRGNTRCFDVAAIRGGTLWFKPSNGLYPQFQPRNVVGHGTLKMATGMQANDNTAANHITVGENVTVEHSVDGALSATQDTWVKWTTFNGPVVVTNGILRAYEGVVYNGPVYIGAYATKSYFSSGDITINGDFEIADGATFNFNSQNFSVGENAKLILNGEAKTSGLTVNFPKIEFRGYTRKYTELPIVATDGEVVIGDGATMKISTENITNGVVAVTLKANGGLTIDATDAEMLEGDVLDLSYVTLDEGVDIDDVTLAVSASEWVWTFAIDEETGKLKATAADDPTVPNVWVGGANGAINTANNWTKGVPKKDQIIEVNNAATILVNSEITVGTLVINADVTFSSSSQKFHAQGMQGTGVVTLDYTGFSNISGSECIVSNDIVFANGAWLGDYNYSIDMKMYGDLSGSGEVKLWGSSGTYYLYGDNSGFTGEFKTTNGHPAVQFMVPEAGFSNASSVHITGTLWLWFTEGTITFSDLHLTSTGERGINMPAETRSGAGITLVVGNNNGTVLFDGTNTYQAYTKNGNGWTTGCDKLTVKKVGTGLFTNNMTAAYNLDMDGGIVSFGTLSNSGLVADFAAGTGVKVTELPSDKVVLKAKAITVDATTLPTLTIGDDLMNSYKAKIIDVDTLKGLKFTAGGPVIMFY